MLRLETAKVAKKRHIKKGDFSMNAPGKGLLKTVSILFIIFGAIATIVAVLAVLAVAALTAVASGVVGELGEAADAVGEVTAAVGGLAILASIVAIINSVLMLVFGIIGVGKKSADPSKAGFYVIAGVILCVLALLSIILSVAFTTSGFPWTSLISFVLPILYIVGGSMNKKALAPAR
jgi:hypothetical protein